MNRSPRNTYRKSQSSVPSNLQKKAKAVATHIHKRRSVNTSKVTCKEKREKLSYEKTETKLNPEGLGFPDNFMAIMGWRRVGLNKETPY